MSLLAGPLACMQLQKLAFSYLGTPSKKKKKIHDKCHIGFDPPPPYMTKNTMYFFKKLDHFWGTFAKKKFFAPLKGQNTCKNF